MSLTEDDIEKIRAVFRLEARQAVIASVIVMADLFALEIEQGRLTTPEAVSRIDRLLAVHATGSRGPLIGTALEVLRAAVQGDLTALASLTTHEPSGSSH
jgi:hypothetical protein